MLTYAEELTASIERDDTIQTRQDVLARLRILGLNDFAELLVTMPNIRYPKISSLLPQMAPDATQIAWTGTSGLLLLEQTIDFVRSMVANYSQITGRPFRADTRVLDYGCGWGRIARLMYFYVNESQYFGLDPWDRSLEECRKCGLTENLHLSEYLPVDLPLPDIKLDLAFAFSVFTHLSRRATITSLAALRKYVQDDGLITFTIRPIEYWSLNPHRLPKQTINQAVQSHNDTGFAFIPHAIPPIDGDVTYGDTTMSLEWIQANIPGWSLAGLDRSRKDDMQIYVFMKPV